MDLAGATLSARAAAVLDAVAAGELAPGQAAQLVNALGTMAKIIETDDLAQRVAKLEERHANTLHPPDPLGASPAP